MDAEASADRAEADEPDPQRAHPGHACTMTCHGHTVTEKNPWATLTSGCQRPRSSCRPAPGSAADPDLA
jgi:hypothetical protein